MKLIKLLANILPEQIAFAHCDVPCGIYDPRAAQIAAQTVKVMVEKIVSTPEVNDKNVILPRDIHNSMTRYVITKEEHAQKCKEELLILWTDYFKPEHLDTFPDLHETFWKAAKLCSKNKQSVDQRAAEELVKAVDTIAEIFKKSKTLK